MTCACQMASWQVSLVNPPRSAGSSHTGGHFGYDWLRSPYGDSASVLAPDGSDI